MRNDELALEKEEMRLFKALSKGPQKRRVSTQSSPLTRNNINNNDESEIGKWNLAKNTIQSGNINEFKNAVRALKDVNMINDPEGNTLLHYCVVQEVEMCKFLLSLGAKLFKNKIGKTPLDLLLEQDEHYHEQYKEIIDMLWVMQ